MTDFTALPVYDGNGPYHFNRYRMAFIKPPGRSKADLATLFTQNFPAYFKSQLASVTFHPERVFEGKPTLEFHGVVDIAGLDVAKPHNDWVARIWIDPTIGFTAQTLKREFFLAEDAAIAGETIAGSAAGGAAVGAVRGAIVGAFATGGPGAAPGALTGAGTGAVWGAGAGAAAAPAAIHYSRMHLLAGRRAWRLDVGSAFGTAGDVLVLETAAVERFSATAYNLADKVLNFEEKFAPIWFTNLRNFAWMNGFTVATQALPGPGWSKPKDPSFDLFYYWKSFPADTGLQQLKSDTEFVKSINLFPLLLP